MVALMIHAMYTAIYYLQQAIGIQLYKLNVSNRKVFYPTVLILLQMQLVMSLPFLSGAITRVKPGVCVYAGIFRLQNLWWIAYPSTDYSR